MDDVDGVLFVSGHRILAGYPRGHLPHRRCRKPHMVFRDVALKRCEPVLEHGEYRAHVAHARATGLTHYPIRSAESSWRPIGWSMTREAHRSPKLLAQVHDVNYR